MKEISLMRKAIDGVERAVRRMAAEAEGSCQLQVHTLLGRAGKKAGVPVERVKKQWTRENGVRAKDTNWGVEKGGSSWSRRFLAWW